MTTNSSSPAPLRPTIDPWLKAQPVAVLYGGETAERPVSLNTGRAIAEALTARGYRVELFDWAAHRLSELAASEFAAVFIALHGGAGENGELQGALELLGIPYTGSGVLASALAMDKVRSKAMAAALGVPTAPWQVWTRAEATGNLARGSMDPPMEYPFVVKPNEDGSSVGVTIVTGPEVEFEVAVRESLEGRGDVLIEKFVSGREISVAVVDGKAIGNCEIVPNRDAGFYSYDAKYERNDTTYLTPSTLPKPMLEDAERYAETLYALLGCTGVARIDFIVDADGPWFLELNTVPGMTATSLVPKIAESRSVSFPELAEWLMSLAKLQSAPR